MRSTLRILEKNQKRSFQKKSQTSKFYCSKHFIVLSFITTIESTFISKLCAIITILWNYMIGNLKLWHKYLSVLFIWPRSGLMTCFKQVEYINEWHPHNANKTVISIQRSIQVEVNETHMTLCHKFQIGWVGGTCSVCYGII